MFSYFVGVLILNTFVKQTWVKECVRGVGMNEGVGDANLPNMQIELLLLLFSAMISRKPTVGQNGPRRTKGLI